MNSKSTSTLIEISRNHASLRFGTDVTCRLKFLDDTAVYVRTLWEADEYDDFSIREAYLDRSGLSVEEVFDISPRAFDLMLHEVNAEVQLKPWYKLAWRVNEGTQRIELVICHTEVHPDIWDDAECTR